MDDGCRSRNLERASKAFHPSPGMRGSKGWKRRRAALREAECLVQATLTGLFQRCSDAKIAESTVTKSDKHRVGRVVHPEAESSFVTVGDHSFAMPESKTGSAAFSGCLLQHGRPVAIAKVDIDDREIQVLRTRTIIVSCNLTFLGKKTP